MVWLATWPRESPLTMALALCWSATSEAFWSMILLQKMQAQRSAPIRRSFS